MISPGIRYLVDDLVLAGADGAVRRDALAGDFCPWRGGDPLRLAGRAPAWITDAAAVMAYAIKPAPRRAAPPAPPPPPPRYLEGRPTDLQLEALAALRRLLDRSPVVTATELAREVGVGAKIFHDLLRGLVDRGLVDKTATARGDLILIGPRAATYPEREVKRTQRSREIEALIRSGKTIDEVIATAMTVDGKPAPPTRAEFYRVRAQYCADLGRKTTPRPTGGNHAAVVELYRSGVTSATEIARRIGTISRARVGQILANAARKGEIKGKP